jgi:hypothetical protein
MVKNTAIPFSQKRGRVLWHTDNKKDKRLRPISKINNNKIVPNKHFSNLIICFYSVKNLFTEKSTYND